MLYSASSVRMWAENSCSSMWAWTREFSSPATQQTLINPRRRLVRRLPADRSYRQRVPWSSCACWPSSFALFRRRPRWRLWSPRWTAGRWSSSTVWSACKHKHSLLRSGVAQGLQTVWNVTSDLCRASKLSSFSTWVSAWTSRRRTEWVCRLDRGSTSKSSSMDLRDTAGGKQAHLHQSQSWRVPLWLAQNRDVTAPRLLCDLLSEVQNASVCLYRRQQCCYQPIRKGWQEISRSTRVSLAGKSLWVTSTQYEQEHTAQVLCIAP